MGHFKLDPQLESQHSDLTFVSPVGLGCRLDPQLSAHEALAKFGIGFIELGPVTADPVRKPKIVLHRAEEEVELSPCEERVSLEAARSLLKSPFDVPVLVRVLADDPTTHKVIHELASQVEGFILVGGADQQLIDLVQQHNCKVFFHLRQETFELLAAFNDTRSIDGYVVEGFCESKPESPRIGKSSYPQTLSLVEMAREKIGQTPTIIATGGIHEPGDGWQLLESGADLVLVDSGMVFSGPGLPKRINEAVLSYRVTPDQPSRLRPTRVRPAQMSWFWTLLLGIGLFCGGVLAFLIAITRVVLPYDEAHSGLTRADLLAINDKLLDFMQHDRVTLAATMLGLGIIYLALSWQGSRGGHHWAYKTIISSAFIGFFSFFLFLGFGYFDPFHAFVTAIMFQFLALAMHSDLPAVKDRPLPELTNDADWQRSQWGQLLMVVHGATLIVAGIVICGFGVTTVFIEDDLNFMETSYDEICFANPMLLPLVAHDRATFGGMTLSTGLAILMSALWGFRRGHRWLWRALMMGGTICYVMTLWIHWKVGYVSQRHMIPVYLGIAMLWTSGCLSYKHLCTVTHKSEEQSDNGLETTTADLV
jgi:hypothetical protein